MPAQDPNHGMQRLGERLLAVAARWSDAPLSALMDPARPPALDAAALAHLLAARSELAPVADDPTAAASRLREELERWLHRKNQFVALDASTRAGLQAALTAALRSVARALAGPDDDDAVAAALRATLATLHAEVASRLRGPLGAAPREVVAGAYSPTLQLQVLGLTLADLPAPVLDVGCGEDAALVRTLRAAGVDAHGIDRAARVPEAIAADWLTFPYGQDRWGAVLSHLGFSLHFLHHHLAGADAAFAHARVYMAILRALRPGGLFAYAPALPFIEAMLPAATYQCERVALADALVTPSLRAMESETGLDLAAATQVRRTT